MDIMDVLSFLFKKDLYSGAVDHGDRHTDLTIVYDIYIPVYIYRI